MKWLKLIGMIVGITGVILMINNFTYKPKTPPPPPMVTAPAATEVPIEEEIEKKEEEKAKPTERTWNVKGTQLPPRPKQLVKATEKKRNGGTTDPTTADNKPSKKGGTSGGSGGGTSGGGGSGSGGGTSGGGGTTTPEPEPDPTATLTHWLQTGEDPAGVSVNGDRHVRGCPKYKNVPGQSCLPTDGNNTCPICQGG